MKTAAITRIKDDEKKLRLWLSYYSKYFDYIFVFGHETNKDFFNSLKKKYEFDYVIDGSHIHSMESLDLISKKQEKLLKIYDWVLYTDADEFVVADPQKYRGLKDFMRRSKEQQTFCEGYEIYRMPDENPIVYTQPILAQRQFWWRDYNGAYNKPALSRIPTKWCHGFHYLEGETDFDKVRNIKDTGLYLIHLKMIEEINSEKKGEYIPEKVRRMF